MVRSVVCCAIAAITAVCFAADLKASDDQDSEKPWTVTALLAAIDGPPPKLVGLPREPGYIDCFLPYFRGNYRARADDEQVLLVAMRKTNRELDRRLATASFLLDLGNAEARKLVDECLAGKYGDAAVRDAALVVLRSGKDIDDTWSRKRVIALMTRAGSPSDSMLWYELCQYAGEIKLIEADQFLIEHLRRHPDDGRAAWALGRIGDPKAIDVLIDTAEHDFEVREDHVRALHKLNAEKLPAILLRHCDNGACLEIIGDLGLKAAIQPIRDYLSVPNGGRTQGVARITLARISATDSKDLAQRLLAIAKQASTVDEKGMAFSYAGPTKQPLLVPALLEEIRTSDDESLIFDCLRALGDIGDSTSLKALVSLFDHDFSYVMRSRRRYSAHAFNDAIIAALRDATGKDYGHNIAAWRSVVD